MKKAVCVFTIFYFILMGAAAVILFVLPSPYTETYLGELPYKIDRLRSTEGKRIILVGGSAVPFGVDCSLIEAELGKGEKVPEVPGRLKDYEVVDFGLYGSIGSKVMLEVLKPYFHRGDIIIVLPEQQEDSLAGYFDGKYLWQALGFGAIRYAFDLDVDERTLLFNRLPAYLLERVQLLLAGSNTADYGIYARDSFNEYGDIGAERDENIMPQDHDPDNMISFDKGLLDKGLFSYLSEYKSICEKNGAVLYLGFAPMNGEALTSSQEEIREYENGLRRASDVTLLGTAFEAIMDPEFFYDTNYHLNSVGAGEYTRRLIKWIRAEYGDRSYTHSAGVVSPDNESSVNESEIDSIEENSEEKTSPDSNKDPSASSGGIIYEAGRNGIRITGLSDELLNSTEIVIPETIDGKPVAAIADGIFSDCGSLRHIVMEPTSPASIRVGRHLLDGCNADILVPEGSLSAYRTNYFWSQYADRIKDITIILLSSHIA